MKNQQEPFILFREINAAPIHLLANTYKPSSITVRSSSFPHLPLNGYGSRYLSIIVATALLFVVLVGSVYALDFLYPAKVERVIDADTIVADLHLGLGIIMDDQCVRLYGIDAWEMAGCCVRGWGGCE